MEGALPIMEHASYALVGYMFNMSMSPLLL